jgi:uncharacterized protein YkwD
MAVRGRHERRTSVVRRPVIAVILSCAVVLAVVVGVRSAMVSGTAAQTAPATPTPMPSVSGMSSSTPGVASATTAVVVAPGSVQPSLALTSSSPQPGSMTDVAQALLAQINGWRAAAGRAPLTMSSGLVASAHQHNLRMSAGCGMRHQCSGEADLGARISAESVTWAAVAENIAWHSSVSGAGVLAAAKALNEAMYHETPPDDGHRRTMLSDAYHRVGIDVIRDAKGEVWVTEDFAN